MSDLARARAHALDVLSWSEIAAALASRCASEGAARQAAALMPDLPKEAAHRSLVTTAEALRLMEGEGGLPVSGVRDVEPAVSLAARGGVVEPADLAAVARTLDALARLRAAVAPREGEAPLLAALAREIDVPQGLASAIDRAIDERGSVREDASPRLVELHRRRAALGSRIEKDLESLRRDPDVAASLSDDFVTLRDGRHVLPVRSDRRLGVPGILHGRSGSGHSLFIEPARIVELNNELQSASIDLEEEIARILRDLSLRVGAEHGALERALRAHRAVDLASARARLARDLGAAAPVLTDGELAMEGLLHPRLLLLRGPLQRATVVANDVALEARQRGIIVTGPNTGGKTVLLEALGLACLMARAGLFVACAEGSRVPWLEAVLADIGDEQSLERSLSSFSGHVAQLKDVLLACEQAGGQALVLVDEIMAGTDPAEGAPLAEAVLEALAATGARVVVTTHLGSLKAFAARSGVFVNAGMEFDEATLRPTYRLTLGVPGASAALSIAERLGLPPRVVARARELAGAGHVSVEALLRDLEAAREDTLRARELARRSSDEASRLREELSRQLEQVRRRDEAFVSQERAAFEREMKALREEAASITRRLQQEPTHAAVADAVSRLDRMRAKGREASEAGGSAPALAPGARVRSKSLRQPGEIVDTPDSHGRVRVRFGAITMQLATDDLEPDATPSRASAPAKRATGAARAAAPPSDDDVPTTPQTPRNTADLRGMTVDEALSKVERTLERAGADGERCVVIIHGHGTGALKAAVRDALEREPLVAAFRAGRAGEGGDGVTVARLA